MLFLMGIITMGCQSKLPGEPVEVGTTINLEVVETRFVGDESGTEAGPRSPLWGMSTGTARRTTSLVPQVRTLSASPI